MEQSEKELFDSELRGYSIRLPEKFHNQLKAEAAIEGLSKDDYFRTLLIAGREVYKANKA